jgi:hypothetical protein
MIIGILLGITVIAMAIWSYFNRLDIIKNKIEVVAKVIRLEKSCGGECGTDYIPVFQYCVDGIKYKKTYSTSSYKHIVGFTTTVYCHKNKPQKSVQLDQIKKGIVLNVISLMFGILLICLAIFF